MEKRSNGWKDWNSGSSDLSHPHGMKLAGSPQVLRLMSYARIMTSRVRTTMIWLHLLGCFAASDSFVLDGLVNETNLHLDMENMIAAAQRTLLQLVTQWQEIRSCRECKTPACDGREDSKARFWCMHCWKNGATVGRIGKTGLQISVTHQGDRFGSLTLDRQPRHRYTGSL